MKNNIMINDVILLMISYFGRDVKRINHSMKVHEFAKVIGQKEKICDETLQILEVAAILHDIGIKESERKYDSSSGRHQEIEGPPIARELLSDFKLENKFIDRICYLIGNHHTYSRIDDEDFQILVEADFLVNIFEDNINARSISLIAEKYFKTLSGKSLLVSMYHN